MLTILHPHSTRGLLSSLIFLFCLLCSHSFFVRADIFIYAACSPEKYQSNSPFEANLNSFLASAVASASQALYDSLATGNSSSDGPEGSVYGLYQCRGDLRPLGCSKCIQGAVSQIGIVCPYSFGATLQLEGCHLRYEHVNFLGRIDIGLVHNKCSRRVNNGVDFFRRRDDVLSDLQTAAAAAGGFRVSSSGQVQGFAQCLGDLNAADCASCLSEAVGKLKILCGSSAAADVFLGQCYARYWASGFYDVSSAGSSNDEEDEDVGKTVAIIVGTVAGIALIIVLLAFCGKAMS